MLGELALLNIMNVHSRYEAIIMNLTTLVTDKLMKPVKVHQKSVI